MKKKLLIPAISVCLGVCTLFGGIAVLNRNVAQARGDEKLSGRWITTANVNTAVDKSKGDFSLVFMGDQQIAECYDDDKKYVAASYDYIAQNADAMNLKMYVNLGDIFDVVDFCDNIGGYNADDPNGRNRGTDDENKYFWQQQRFVSEQVQKLQDADVPVALTMGNHDYEDMGHTYRITKTFSEAFPLTRFSQYAVAGDTVDNTHYFGGALDNDVENAYYFFEGNGQKYMTLVLGIHPDDRIIAWANEAVERNPDCKVIVSTHAYLTGTGRYEEADYLWDNFLSLHENILMVTCGHDWIDGSIVKQVDFGVHGNPVYQFMIDTQGEEYGGLGVFAQMIFRADGSVDVAYYAPAVDTYREELVTTDMQGKYFGANNQFRFDLNLKAENVSTTGEIILGNTISGKEAYENYASYRADNRMWQKNVYAYNGVSIATGKGLQANGAGYIVYKLNAGECNRVKKLNAYINGNLSEGVCQIDVSKDGKTYIAAAYWDSVVNTFKDRRLTSEVLGAKELYIRLVLKGVTLADAQFTATTVKTGVEQKNFNVTYDYSNTQEYTTSNWDRDVYRSLEAVNVVGDGVIGTGTAKDHEGAKAYVLYRIEGGERAFERLKLSVDMRIREVAQSYTFTARDVSYNGESAHVLGGTYYFKDTDSLYALRVSVQAEGDSGYTLVKTFNNAENIGENVTFDLDLTQYADGKKDVIVKLEYFGVRWNDVGLKKVSFTGVLDGEDTKKATVELNGGVVYDNEAIPVKDGYVFDGWRLNGANGEKVNYADYAGKEVTLVATWKKLYRITYVLDGGENAEGNEATAREGETLTLAEAKKEGYRFVGWYTGAGEKVTEITLSKNIAVYAIWVKK